MSKSIKFNNNVYLDSSSVTHRRKNLQTIIDNYISGKTREDTVVNSFVRLFSLELVTQWKECNVLFSLSSSQSGAFSSLTSLIVHKSSTSESVVVPCFSTVNFFSDISTRLVAVITGINMVEVYYKMGGNQSPTLNILSISKLRTEDYWGKVTVDCNTVVSTLPSGTVKYVTNLI